MALASCSHLYRALLSQRRRGAASFSMRQSLDVVSFVFNRWGISAENTNLTKGSGCQSIKGLNFFPLQLGTFAIEMDSSSSDTKKLSLKIQEYIMKLSILQALSIKICAALLAIGCDSVSEQGDESLRYFIFGR